VRSRHWLPERAEGALLRAVLALPEPLQRALAGRPVVADGQTMSVEVQLLLRVLRLVPSVDRLPWPAARREFDRQLRLIGGRQPIAAVRDLTVDGADGPLPARLYVPTERLRDSAAPTMLYLHGGGHVYGGLRSYDAALRFLAEQSGVQVLAVEYRLAPEHPFPAAVDDAAAAYAWLVDHTGQVGADPERLAVGGDSAGGHLAATTAIRAAEKGLPVRFQLLVYPVTDFGGTSASRRMFDGYYLDEHYMRQAEDAFFAAAEDRRDPLASLVQRTSLPAGLPPAYVVTAGFDPLRDEGEAYAQLLAESGVEVELGRQAGMIHGFLNIVGVGREATAHSREIAQRVRTALA
jgi:acetyl esterase